MEREARFQVSCVPGAKTPKLEQHRREAALGEFGSGLFASVVYPWLT